MTLLEILQRITAFFLLCGALRLILIALSISTWGLEGWVYGVIAVFMAWALVKLARYPFETAQTRS